MTRSSIGAQATYDCGTCGLKHGVGNLVLHTFSEPVPPLVFSDHTLTVDQPIAKAGSTRLQFEGPR